MILPKARSLAALLFAFATALTVLASTPEIVPLPSSFIAGKGSVAKTDLNGGICFAPGVGIDRNLALEWLGEAGFATDTIADAAEASVSIAVKPGATGNREGYILDITDKRIDIVADTDAGLIWALQTLRQYATDKKRLPPISITDVPTHPWRSYLMDESRHFFGVEAAEKVIDELSRLKMNVLHWHLIDGAGWRIEIPQYPRLTEIGAKLDYTHRFVTPEQWDSIYPGRRAYYNADEIRHVVDYARRRGVTVMPEIEMPGHELAAIASYHWLGTTTRMAGKPVTGDLLNVADPSVEQFLRDVLDYVIDLFGLKTIHIGGDEAEYKHWTGSPGVSSFMAENGLTQPWELQDRLVRRMASYLAEKGVRMMGWNEITGHDKSRRAEVDGTIAQFWQGDISALTQAAAQGYLTVNSDQLYTYLDYDYDGTPLWKCFRFNPVPVNMDASLRDKVIGFGAQMWAEKVPDFRQLCHMTFPRIAALAERGWSPANNTDYSDFMRRVQPLQSLWRSKGIINDQPVYDKKEPKAKMPKGR
ncbi:MAG: beta-N-acetylhexosaminidase [Muribaculaceae bacterium]|nr:beta-N-acetylhexosaminidase [Muribaculaceae bacterium]